RGEARFPLSGLEPGAAIVIKYINQCAPRVRRSRVKQRNVRWMMLVFALMAIMTLGACKKKVAPPPPPPPPPLAAPTASLTANPSTVDKGGSTTLTWQTSNATDVSIEWVGAVQPNGSKGVTPNDSTTYTLTAKGAGGVQTATARVTVN